MTGNWSATSTGGGGGGEARGGRRADLALARCCEGAEMMGGIGLEDVGRFVPREGGGLESEVSGESEERRAWR